VAEPLRRGLDVLDGPGTAAAAADQREFEHALRLSEDNGGCGDQSPGPGKERTSAKCHQGDLPVEEWNKLRELIAEYQRSGNGTHRFPQ
jgi:hypothetical protein